MLNKRPTYDTDSVHLTIEVSPKLNLFVAELQLHYIGIEPTLNNLIPYIAIIAVGVPLEDIGQLVALTARTIEFELNMKLQARLPYHGVQPLARGIGISVKASEVNVHISVYLRTEQTPYDPNTFDFMPSKMFIH